MTEAEEDLSGHYPVQESKIVNHPEYANPVLMTRFGWAKRKGLFGREVRWYETKIEPIKGKDE